MILESQGTRVELVVRGYEFPSAHTEDDDANWLQVYVNVQQPDRQWSFTDPALQTQEVERLAQWLRSIRRGRAGQTDLSFIEPDLQFTLVPKADRPRRLRITFTHGSVPPALLRTEHAYEGVNVELALADLDLEAAADSLEGYLRQYPPRWRQ